jgi:DNA repair protein RecN (Recombination protein N)
MLNGFYLKQLVLQNFVTFKNQSITFRQGLNSIIGETGSGKSLVLEAINLILGGRSDKKIIRKNSDYTLLEASFYCSDKSVHEFLEEYGYPVDSDEIVIKRVIHRNGTNKNYVNHLSCPLSFLNSFSKRFIDVVGQFENQKLLSENYQLTMLDQFAKLQEELSQYQSQFKSYKTLLLEQEKLKLAQSSRDQRLDFIRYQIEEIEALKPTEDEEALLLSKKEKIQNFDRTQKLHQQCQSLMSGEENNLGFLNAIQSLSSIFRKNTDIFSRCLTTLSELEDKAFELKSTIDDLVSLELSNENIEEILERLDRYQKIKRKFKGSVQGILSAYDELKNEREQLEKDEVSLGKNDHLILNMEKNLTSAAHQIHKKRIQASTILENELTKRIQNLNMLGAKIKTPLVLEHELTETGLSKVSFLSETNSGEGFHKIKDIASGGELSRILLAVRQILSSCESISIFLFDEIDTGIGGETANLIGKALKEVAIKGQVIAITHLPQIAQFSDSLIVVNKELFSEGDEVRTESTVRDFTGIHIQKEAKAMVNLSALT